MSSEWLTADKHLLSDVSQRPFPQVQVQTINSVAQVHHLVSNDKQLNIHSVAEEREISTGSHQTTLKEDIGKWHSTVCSMLHYWQW